MRRVEGARAKADLVEPEASRVAYQFTDRVWFQSRTFRGFSLRRMCT
jgi:hypothetical protein